MATALQHKQRGFTLVEILIVLAVLGVLAAVVVPNVIGFIGKGSARALDSDNSTISLAVSSFKADTHAGISSSQWGLGSKGKWFPTSDGKSATVELSTANFDADFPDNPRILKYKAGPGGNGDAADADITAAAIWLGLLFQEPFGTAGTTYTENTFTGSAHPMATEGGQYIKELPASAAETNTDTDATHTNGNGLTSGSYIWVILENGDVASAYKGSDTKWYAGFKDAYP